MKLILPIVFCLFIGLSSQAQTFAIGRSSVSIQDDSRNRTIPVELYYPAVTAGNNAEWAEGVFPLIILGHGFSMTYSAYENISSFFVPKGYVFAMLDTENGLFSVSHGDFAADYVFVKNNLSLSGIEGARVAYLGHSMGGGAAFLAAAQDTQLDLLIGMAPAETNPSAISASSSIEIPTFVFSGQGDAVTPPAENHIPMYDACNASCKGFINVIGGAHCYFAQTNFFCDFGETTAGSNIQITRAQQQDVLFDFLDPLFETFLSENSSAFEVFSDSLATSSRVSGSHTCDELALQNAGSNDNILSVYPSPAGEIITLESVKQNIGKYEIINMSGQTVASGEVSDKTAVIPVKNLSPGVYLLKTKMSQIRFLRSHD